MLLGKCIFSLNKLLICCSLIVSKVVVKFRYRVGLRDLKYDHALQNKTLILVNKQYASIKHANKRLVNSEN